MGDCFVVNGGVATLVDCLPLSLTGVEGLAMSVFRAEGGESELGDDMIDTCLGAECVSSADSRLIRTIRTWTCDGLGINEDMLLMSDNDGVFADYCQNDGEKY